MQKLLTIVVPVYKVEPYINKCLDSCILEDEQLMSQMEVIIINDGTPDNSAEMSREYVKRYPKVFRQIDKENGGHGSVWNLGVMEAKGKYVKFLDSDDWFQNLDLFLNKLAQTDADLVLTSTRDHCEHNEIWRQEILDMEFYKTYDTNTFDWLGNRSDNYLLHHCCCYKTEVLRQYMPGLFLEKQPYDDIVLWPVAMIGAKSIEAFDFTLYNYLMDRPGQSISAEARMKQINAHIKSVKHAILFYENHPVEEGTTKADYIQNHLPKYYNTYYKNSITLPYKQGKQVAADWDKWVKQTNPTMRTIWIKLYRGLPYGVFRMAYNILIPLYSKLKRKSAVQVYKKE